MTNQPPLLVFGEDWGAHPTSTQHFMKRILRNRDIVWVNSIGMRRPRFTPHDIRRALAKARAMVRQGSRQDSECDTAMRSIISPVALPWPANPIARSINRKLLPARIKASSRGFMNERPIAWLSLPTAVDALDGLDPRATVYYAGDDFSALAGVDHEPVLKMECELVERADMIIAASPAIASKFPVEKTYVVPHGCDYSLFSNPSCISPQLPTGRPIAGFYGSISEWLDIGLLTHAAKELPDWNFVLIGPVSTDIAELSEFANVHFLGPRPHHELPAFSQHWTVSLLPFKRNQQIRACNPLKLREYMASGRPIVTTEFPALDGYRDVVSIADSPESFVRAIQLSQNETPAQMLTRSKRVESESWMRRANDIEKLLNTLR